MDSLALFFSAAGRIAPKRFAVGVALVYLVAFLSQLLISPRMMLHAGVLPFALIQGVAIWAWFCLHVKRLRDADRDPGLAMAIAVLYGLGMILLLLVVALSVPPDEMLNQSGHASSHILIVPYLIEVLSGDLGLFAHVAAGIAALIVAPMLIALGFSVWAATRPRAPSSAAV